VQCYYHNKCGYVIYACTLGVCVKAAATLLRTASTLPADMSWLEHEAFQQMYERAGFMATDDGALVMLAGSTLGGGETTRQYPSTDCGAW
jgi:hypothetical protein